MYIQSYRTELGAITAIGIMGTPTAKIWVGKLEIVTASSPLA
jgi:hypothetical protein